MRSVACQTDFAVDEETRHNEAAINLYLDIINILDDEPAPVIHDLGERAAAQMLRPPDIRHLSINSQVSSNEGTKKEEGSRRLCDLEDEDFFEECRLRDHFAEIRSQFQNPVEKWLQDQSDVPWRTRQESTGTAVSSTDGSDRVPVTKFQFMNCFYQDKAILGSTLCVEIEDDVAVEDELSENAKKEGLLTTSTEEKNEEEHSECREAEKDSKDSQATATEDL